MFENGPAESIESQKQIALTRLEQATPKQVREILFMLLLFEREKEDEDRTFELHLAALKASGADSRVINIRREAKKLVNLVLNVAKTKH